MEKLLHAGDQVIYHPGIAATYVKPSDRMFLVTSVTKERVDSVPGEPFDGYTRIKDARLEGVNGVVPGYLLQRVPEEKQIPQFLFKGRNVTLPK